MASHASPTPAPADPFQVVIAGGGVAALEAALFLHETAGERVALTLLSPAADFVYRPTSVLEPFVRRPPRRLPLTVFAADHSIDLVRDELASVDTDRQVASTRMGQELHYDALLVAVGARATIVLPDAKPIDPAHMSHTLHRAIDEINRGVIDHLALVAPEPSWPLPAYEVALLAAERARQRDLPLTVTVITEEERPVARFGPAVSDGVAAELSRAGVELLTGSSAQMTGDAVIITPGGASRVFDRVLALPRLGGPEIPGLPADENGFLAITEHCQIPGAGPVYAAGDATQFPVKFGGIAAQQADAAAAPIAALAGAHLDPAPFDGHVHGMVINGTERPRLYFEAEIRGASAVSSRCSDQPTETAETKIAARYLAPYLEALWSESPRWLTGQLAWERTLGILEAQARLGFRGGSG
jgi:sulfide:quinone oxidoreductase